MCQTLQKAFDMSSRIEKVSPIRLRKDDQESVKRVGRSPVKRHLRNPYFWSDRSEVEKCFRILTLRIDLKALDKQEKKAIGGKFEGLEPSPFLGTDYKKA